MSLRLATRAVAATIGGLDPSAALGHTVLVVDDDAPTRWIVVRILRSEGFACAQAGDGEEGVQLALEVRPDLILMDLSMPKLGGLAALRRIRRDFRASSTPVIFLTANGDVDSVVEHLGAGGDDYLVKPVVPAELVARVRLALRRAEALRDLNPLTGFPGNSAILREITSRATAGRSLACMHVDIDAFKDFNDRYGFVRGDLAIKATADVLVDALQAVPCAEHFAGHVGGDDFVVVTAPALAEAVAREITQRFDQATRGLYDPGDRQRGWIEVRDRRGRLRRTGLMSVSIGVARTDSRRLDSAGQIAAVASEMKAFAKRELGSAWAVDRRR
jgi:diguanylate cyclase (GGDEF)-like protein